MYKTKPLMRLYIRHLSLTFFAIGSVSVLTVVENKRQTLWWRIFVLYFAH